MRRLVGALLLLWPSLAWAQAMPSWTWAGNDTQTYAESWTQLTWAPSVGCVINMFGNSHNAKGNNSVRCLDVASGTWSTWWPNSNGMEGLPNRDNVPLVYTPLGPQGEVWALGGSSVCAAPCNVPQPLPWGGVFDLASRTWTLLAYSPADFESRVTGISAWARHITMAQGSCDSGAYVFWDGPSQLLELIEPTPGGPAPYAYSRVAFYGQPGVPPIRNQIMGAGVCAGSTFYLAGGHNQSTGTEIRDFWALDVPTRTWMRLADPPVMHKRPIVTFDPVAGALVLFGGTNSTYTRDLYSYAVSTGVWTTWWDDAAGVYNMILTEPRPRPNQGHLGIYVPLIQQHVYTGNGVWNVATGKGDYTLAKETDLMAFPR